MSALAYPSGEIIEIGDQITYHSEQGYVEFVVTQPSADASMNWYLEQFPGGGAMIIANGFGRVFLPVDDVNNLLEFVGRRPVGSE